MDMEDQTGMPFWRPKPFSVAVLDSDETLTDALCTVLQDYGFAARAFYDLSSLMEAHRASAFDAYVLDFLADWHPASNGLETLIASIREGESRDVPVFVLGNHAAPERAGRLGGILMGFSVRYQLKPVRVEYLARQVMEAVARRAGI
jgi:DNA-binding response OmpR family regulator